MLGHALGVMNRQAFSVTMRDMVSKERMKVDDIRKPACQHDDETVEQNNPDGIVSYWMHFKTTPLDCVRPRHTDLVHHQSLRRIKQ